MAKELYSVKVEGETKEDLNRLTERYVEQGLISEKGDLLNLAADLLERNLSILTPRHTVGIEELDQLTSRINRLFVGMIEQNNTSVEMLKVEFEDKYEKAKLTIDSLLEEKQGLKDRLTESNIEINELTELTRDNQGQLSKLLGEIEDKNKYIRLLEGQINDKDSKIEQLTQFESQNKELTVVSEQKDQEIQELLNRIAELETAKTQLKQDHQNEIRNLQFEKKEALFAKEKELNERYNKELSELRQRQAEFLDKHEDRMNIIQEKYNEVLSEKQRIEALYEALKENSNQRRGNKPGGNK